MFQRSCCTKAIDDVIGRKPANFEATLHHTERTDIKSVFFEYGRAPRQDCPSSLTHGLCFQSESGDRPEVVDARLIVGTPVQFIVE